LDCANSWHGRKRVTRFQMEAIMATGTDHAPNRAGGRQLFPFAARSPG
jgi:hypothetical protein